ncbi:MAG: protein-glutamate O-methyltransferase CheR [Pseudomonadales bacterium]
MTQEEFELFRDLVYQWTGVAIADARVSMLASRLGSRMRAVGETDYQAYYALVTSDARERALFVDKVTTHETSFFRTAGVWEFIEHQLLPELRAQQSPLRAWSAAASTGEESYSLAMLATEYSLKAPGFSFSIDASDISEQVIERCRGARYQGRNIRRFEQSRPEYCKKYMEPDQDQFGVSRAISSRVNFFTHNLLQDPKSHAKYNLVMLRNVLIYFTPEDQCKVVANVRRAMTDDGIMIIGESETIPHEALGFGDVAPFVYRVGGTPQAQYAHG